MSAPIRPPYNLPQTFFFKLPKELKKMSRNDESSATPTGPSSIPVPPAAGVNSLHKAPDIGANNEKEVDADKAEGDTTIKADGDTIIVEVPTSSKQPILAPAVAPSSSSRPQPKFTSQFQTTERRSTRVVAKQTMTGKRNTFDESSTEQNVPLKHESEDDAIAGNSRTSSSSQSRTDPSTSKESTPSPSPEPKPRYAATGAWNEPPVVQEPLSFPMKFPHDDDYHIPKSLKPYYAQFGGRGRGRGRHAHRPKTAEIIHPRVDDLADFMKLPATKGNHDGVDHNGPFKYYTAAQFVLPPKDAADPAAPADNDQPVKYFTYGPDMEKAELSKNCPSIGSYQDEEKLGNLAGYEVVFSMKKEKPKMGVIAGENGIGVYGVVHTISKKDLGTLWRIYEVDRNVKLIEVHITTYSTWYENGAVTDPALKQDGTIKAWVRVTMDKAKLQLAEPAVVQTVVHYLHNGMVSATFRQAPNGYRSEVLEKGLPADRRGSLGNYKSVYPLEHQG